MCPGLVFGHLLLNYEKISYTMLQCVNYLNIMPIYQIDDIISYGSACLIEIEPYAKHARRYREAGLRPEVSTFKA
jgi:hypothetical protein